MVDKLDKLKQFFADYYHQELAKLYRNLVPKGKKVLEIGCGGGELLGSMDAEGTGVDISEKMIKKARKNFPKLKFIEDDAQSLKIQEKFDYVILADLIGHLDDIQQAFENLHKVSTDKTRIIISYYNFLWEPILLLAEKIGLKKSVPTQNWLSMKDIENLLFLANLEVIKKGNIILLPVKIPIISLLFNKYLARLPIIKQLGLIQYLVVRQMPICSDKDYSVSVIIPARNEVGNIEQAVLGVPNLGKSTEIIFVEGGSKDNTLETIVDMISKYKDKKDIKLVKQGRGAGKGDAVRKGFAKARGDILMILDGDLTMPPQELPKYYHAVRVGKGELVMGSRLVYPLEADAMRFLNILGNKFFSLAFSFLLDQPIKDTLCGTKVLFRFDYEEIANNRSYFGEFDPFGDYDLIFGAAKLNLKITEVPIRYKARTYGTTNISRFKHGLLLLRMTIFAMRKIKFV